MALLDVVFRVLDKAGASFIEPRREDGHGSTDLDPTHTADSGETEYLHATFDLTGAGDNTLITPALGKRIRVRWFYAINNPVSDTGCKIKVKFGTNAPVYNVWAISKRQKITGGVNEPLIVNLSATGDVAVTVIYEEVT